MMTEESLKDAVRRELPGWLRQDSDFRAWVLEITRDAYASRTQTQDWFHEILDELRRDREEQRAKWDDQNRKWGEENRKWEEQNRKWDEQNRKWDLFQAETREEFRRVHEAQAIQAAKLERTLGALGARWGIQSEQAFRNALAGILEQSFGVEVLNINEYDDEGTVFGRPEQIELDFSGAGCRVRLDPVGAFIRSLTAVGPKADADTVIPAGGIGLPRLVVAIQIQATRESSPAPGNLDLRAVLVRDCAQTRAAVKSGLLSRLLKG